MFDLCATARLVRLYGIEAEGNPIGKWLLKNEFRVYIFKLLIPTIAMFVIHWLQAYLMARICMWVILALFVILTVYHIVLLVITKQNKGESNHGKS